MSIAAFLFAANGIVVKFLSPQIPVMQCMVFRYFVALLFIVPMMLRQRVPFWGKQRSMIVARCMLGFVASLLQYYAFTKLHIAYAMALLYTSPLFIGLLSGIFLKEFSNKTLLFYIFLSFVACLLIIQPQWDARLFYSVICLVSAMCTAGAQMVIRKLHASESFLTIVFNFLFWSGVMSLILGVNHLVMPTAMQWFWLIFLGFSGGSAQMSMTYAFKFAQSNVISPYMYLVVLFSAVFEWILWGEMLDSIALFGVVMLIFSGIAIARWKPKDIPFDPQAELEAEVSELAPVK